MSGVAHRLVLIRHGSNEWNLVLHSNIDEQLLGKGARCNPSARIICKQPANCIFWLNLNTHSDPI